MVLLTGGVINAEVSSLRGTPPPPAVLNDAAPQCGGSCTVGAPGDHAMACCRFPATERHQSLAARRVAARTIGVRRAVVAGRRTAR
jgi:hypothetical protein